MGKLISIEIDHIPDNAPCDCQNCEWVGPIAACSEVLDAVLTPGDPSPCGRCPECDALCYLTRAEDGVTDAAAALLAAVVQTIEDADDTGCDGCFVINAATMTALISARDQAQKYDDVTVPAADTSMAGKPWTAQEDARLLELFDEGKPIANITYQFKRTRRGVEGRLVKLGRLTPGEVS